MSARVKIRAGSLDTFLGNMLTGESVTDREQSLVACLYKYEQALIKATGKGLEIVPAHSGFPSRPNFPSPPPGGYPNRQTPGPKRWSGDCMQKHLYKPTFPTSTQFSTSFSYTSKSHNAGSNNIPRPKTTRQKGLPSERPKSTSSSPSTLPSPMRTRVAGRRSRPHSVSKRDNQKQHSTSDISGNCPRTSKSMTRSVYIEYLHKNPRLDAVVRPEEVRREIKDLSASITANTTGEYNGSGVSSFNNASRKLSSRSAPASHQKGLPRIPGLLGMAPRPKTTIGANDDCSIADILENHTLRRRVKHLEAELTLIKNQNSRLSGRTRTALTQIDLEANRADPTHVIHKEIGEISKDMKAEILAEGKRLSWFDAADLEKLGEACSTHRTSSGGTTERTETARNNDNNRNPVPAIGKAMGGRDGERCASESDSATVTTTVGKSARSNYTSCKERKGPALPIFERELAGMSSVHKGSLQTKATHSQNYRHHGTYFSSRYHAWLAHLRYAGDGIGEDSGARWTNVLDGVAAIMEAKYAVLYEYNQGTECYNAIAVNNAPLVKSNICVMKGDGPIGLCNPPGKKCRNVNVRDMRRDPRFPTERTFCGHQVRALLCIPVGNPQDEKSIPWNVLQVADKVTEAAISHWNREHEIIAEAMAWAMGRVRELARMRKSVKDHQAMTIGFFESVRSLVSAKEMYVVALNVVKKTRHLFDSDYALLFRVDHEAKELVLVAHSSREVVFIPQGYARVKNYKGMTSQRVPLVAKSLATMCATTVQPVSISDAKRDCRFNVQADEYLAEGGTNCVLVMPVMDTENRKVIRGVHILGRTKKLLFKKSDEVDLHGFLDLMAICINRIITVEKSHLGVDKNMSSLRELLSELQEGGRLPEMKPLMEQVVKLQQIKSDYNDLLDPANNKT